jgi:molybdate transport system substrate-binding protein
VACAVNPDEATGTDQENNQLTIYAAASLAEVFMRFKDVFEARHPEIEVVISFAGSQQIAQQLSQGAPGDLFASANLRQMENAINSGRVVESSVQEFVHNKLVLILPEDNPGNIKALGDLSKPNLKIILADDSVPVGAYSQEMLAQASQDGDYESEFKSKVLANVVSYEENVRAVLTKILLGEADAGLVYASDAAGESAGDLLVIDIPDEINITAKYYIAPIDGGHNEQIALDFISLVRSTEGQEILNDYGFVGLAR